MRREKCEVRREKALTTLPFSLLPSHHHSRKEHVMTHDQITPPVRSARSMPNGRTDVIKAIGNLTWGDLDESR